MILYDLNNENLKNMTSFMSNYDLYYKYLSNKFNLTN